MSRAKLGTSWRTISDRAAIFIFIAILSSCATESVQSPSDDAPSQEPPAATNDNQPPPPDSAETPAASSQPPAATENAQPLPEIEAKTSTIKIVKASTSGRVFLMEGATPAVGKILLLRTPDDSNVMALRVLKSMPDKNEVIAKKIRQYPGHDNLAAGDQYTAVEKISDITPRQPTAEEVREMQELDPPKQYEPDLDAASSPAPNENVADEDPEEARIGHGVQEAEPYRPVFNWLSVGGALLRNHPDTVCDEDGNCSWITHYYTGGGLRYGYTIKDRWLLADTHYLDSLTLEGGVYAYTVLDIAGDGSSYTVMPILATLRYNVFLNDSWGLFAYGGFMKNFVMSSSPAANKDTSDDNYVTHFSNLSSIVPSGGVGAFLQVGPQWYFRLDLGYDMANLGLSLRF